MSKLAVLVCLCSLSVTWVKGYTQELKLYETKGTNTEAGATYHAFYSGVGDTSGLALDRVDYACVLGVWTFYTGADYTGFSHFLKGGHELPICYKNIKTTGNFSSFKYEGPATTAGISITFFAEPNFHGQSLSIPGKAFANIDNVLPAVRSWIISGASCWDFYPGSNFEGNKTHIGGVNSAPLNILADESRTIGSVARGCSCYGDFQPCFQNMK